MMIRSRPDRLPVSKKEENDAACGEIFQSVSARISGCLGTRSFWFFRQEFFELKKKIKFRFFLVAVARDFLI
jgi:hypothetical protein